MSLERDAHSWTLDTPDTLDRSWTADLAKSRSGDSMPVGSIPTVDSARRTTNSPRQVVGNRFVIRRGKRLVLVPIAEIRWVDAAGNYVRLQTADQAHLLRMTMKDAEQILAPHGFVRIHRSTVVRCDEVVEIRATPSGDHEVTLADGAVKRWSRGYRDRLEAFLEG